MLRVSAACPDSESWSSFMNVGGRNDVLAMKLVKAGESLPLSARGNRYILTLVDCLTRYAIAIPISDQSSETVFNSVIGNYITVYGTTRRILTARQVL